MHLAVGTKFPSEVVRSLPSTADATDSQSLKSERFGRAIRWLLLPSFLPNVASMVAACPFLSSSDSHKRRTHPDEAILAWTCRSLLLHE